MIMPGANGSLFLMDDSKRYFIPTRFYKIKMVEKNICLYGKADFKMGYSSR